MSIGGLIGAVAGGVIGFIIGGPAGAFMGASLGFSLGMMVDPMTPDIKNVGNPVQPIHIMSNEIGEPIADLLGTGKIVGHLLFYGKERSETTYEKVKGGKGGSKKKKVETGHRYYASWAVGICAGPVDAVYTIFKDEKIAWEGEVVRPASGGQETILIGVPPAIEVPFIGPIIPAPRFASGIYMGSMTFYFGTDDQVANSKVAAILPDGTLNSPYRGMCWAFFDDCYIGTFNRVPTMRFVVRRCPTFAFSDKQLIQICDYNAAHTIWYILHWLTELPESWLNTVAFQILANLVSTEGRGISLLMSGQQTAENYLEAINNHMDLIIKYGSDGQFHPKPIRDDYVVADLTSFDESIMLDKPIFARKSWIDTINEVKVQYSEIDRPIPVEPWIFDFVPQDMVFDGLHFYICGNKHTTSPADIICKVVKLNISLELIDYGEYNGIVSPSLGEDFSGIREDGDSIFLAGAIHNGNNNVAILQKRPKSDLSQIDWTYTYSVGGVDCRMQEPEVDSDFIYGAGAKYPAGLQVKLNKGDGSLVWLRNFNTSRVGILQEGNYVYPIGHSSGWLSVQKVLKTNPDSYADYNFGSTGVLYRGGIYDGHIYVSGRSPGFGDTQGITMKIRMSDMVEIWRYLRNTAVGGADVDMKCKCDGNNVFVLGQTGDPLDATLEKLNMSGGLILSKTIVSCYYAYAIIELGNYLYLGYRAYPTSWPCTAGIERRLKSTLEIG